MMFAVRLGSALGRMEIPRTYWNVIRSQGLHEHMFQRGEVEGDGNTPGPSTSVHLE